jgi:hypothetical protein
MLPGIRGDNKLLLVSLLTVLAPEDEIVVAKRFEFLGG